MKSGGLADTRPSRAGTARPAAINAPPSGGLIIPASPPNLPGGMVHRLCQPQVGASVETKQ